MAASHKLFTPIQLGKDLVLKNRIALAPMTRARSDIQTAVPNELNQLYYEQRAGAGLLITEATAISQQGFGWYGTPALYNQAHVDGWRKVVDRVHAKDSKIFLQLWHMGRQAHASFNPKNECVSASAIPVKSGHVYSAKGEQVPYSTPRALETSEIPGIVEDYRKSAELAKQAGFDGVEIHGGNGYLVDQFLQSATNHRSDQYGGSIENRARFLLEIVEALKTVWPSDRIAVRLSPNSPFAEMGSVDNYEQFVYTMEQLSTHGLAYLAILDGFGFGTHDKGRLVTAFDAKKAFKGTVMGNNSYTRDTAEGAINTGAVDLVSFGRPFISNPDLPARFANDWELNGPAPHDVHFNPSKGAEGYTDFATYAK